MKLKSLASLNHLARLSERRWPLLLKPIFVSFTPWKVNRSRIRSKRKLPLTTPMAKILTTLGTNNDDPWKDLSEVMKEAVSDPMNKVHNEIQGI
jgi:hypothetical protein